MSARTAQPRLITIPISHYCEKARWALDRAGVAFIEERHLQGIHIWRAVRAGGGRTVPVLVAGREVVADSSEILAWVDRRLPPDQSLYPDGVAAEVRRLESWLDDGLGPDGRLWMYHGTLPVIRSLRRWALAGTPQLERRMFELFGWALDPFIRAYLGVDEKSARRALENVHGAFDEVATLLSDGRRYLTGERFTAADITFGALSSAVLVPAAYGSPLPPPGALPAPMAAEVRRLRDHPAGRFAARLYESERRPSRR